MMELRPYNLSLNDQLMRAVSDYDVDDVKRCLAQGADPNYLDQWEGYQEQPEWQPNTPLRMVVFRISDSMLEDEHLELFLKITHLLLEAGSNPVPALQLSELRYGAFGPHWDSNTPFTKIIAAITERLAKP